MTTATMTTANVTCSNGGRKFESQTCGRCGGSGRYSFCPGYGDRCFKCGGAGRVYTKRGAAAAEFFARSLEKPVAELVVGDVVFYRGFVAGSFVQASRWLRVVEVTRGASGCSFVKDGVRVESEVYRLRCEVVGKPGEEFVLGCALDGRERVKHSDEDKRAKYAAALAFEDTLTKQGKPRKGVAR